MALPTGEAGDAAAADPGAEPIYKSVQIPAIYLAGEADLLVRTGLGNENG